VRQLLWPLAVAGLCVPLALLAYGVRLPGLAPTQYAAPVGVPDGDREVAWFHTTTSGSTWERFVSGVHRAAVLLPGLTVDDSAAFLDQTAAVPEVVVGMAGRPGKLRIRWYKIASDHRPAYWVDALAARSPPPLAVIGGGSSDRARDMAWALARRDRWAGGDRPLFLLTTASAETVYGEADDGRPDGGGHMVPLLDIYPGRTFRFCFSNRQMAEAMLDFVWRTPALRPQRFTDLAAQAVGGGLLAGPALARSPGVYYVEWGDDPYSSDLLDMVKQELPRTLAGCRGCGGPTFSGWQVPFSVGGFYRPNRAEEEAADRLLKELAAQPPQRSLLVLPTVAAPARRLLRTLAEADPTVGRRLVAVNGDGMGVNTVIRDGEFAWPVHAIPVPLLLFTHNNPVGWDEPGGGVPAGGELRPPSSTEDVLHFADLVRTLAAAAYGVPCEPTAGPAPARPLVARADDLAERLRTRTPAFFDPTGNRLGGTGEYVLLVTPTDDRAAGLPDATVEVWRRTADRGWRLVRAWPLDQSGVRGSRRDDDPGRRDGG
jgi:hypothetical protein